MATQVLSTVFLLKRGLSEAWDRNNPILMAGEPGWSLDTRILKIGDGKTPWKQLAAVNDFEVTSEDIQTAVNNYLEKHPVNIKTDATLSVAGQAADAKAVRDNCLFSSDCLILSAGDADDNIFV